MFGFLWLIIKHLFLFMVTLAAVALVMAGTAEMGGSQAHQMLAAVLAAYICGWLFLGARPQSKYG